MKSLFSRIIFALFTTVSAYGSSMDKCSFVESSIIPQNNCVSFSVSSGTGCVWMCNYCANQLATTNYYFTTDVCKYQSGGCVGNPQVGVTYTCCSA